MNNFAKENMGKWKSFIDRLEIYEKGMDLFGSSIDSPDLGFLALIDFISLTQNDPKPLISILFLFFKDSIIAFWIRSAERLTSVSL